MAERYSMFFKVTFISFQLGKKCGFNFPQSTPTKQPYLKSSFVVRMVNTALGGWHIKEMQVQKTSNRINRSMSISRWILSDKNNEISISIFSNHDWASPERIVKGDGFESKKKKHWSSSTTRLSGGWVTRLQHRDRLGRPRFLSKSEKFWHQYNQGISDRSNDLLTRSCALYRLSHWFHFENPILSTNFDVIPCVCVGGGGGGGTG